MRKRFNKFVKNIFGILSRPEMSILPGHLAYYLVLALVPTITLITFAAGALDIPTKLGSYYHFKLSNDVFTLLEPSRFKGDSLSFIIIFVISLYLSSNGTNSVIIAANNIYGIKNGSYLKTRAKAIFMVFIIVLLFLICLITPFIGNLILDSFSSYPQYNLIHKIASFMKYPFLLIIIFIFIKLLYTIAPGKDIENKRTNLGTIVCSTGWLIAASVYSFYLTHVANYNTYYNALADFIALMFLIYILSYIFVLGMAVNYTYEK